MNHIVTGIIFLEIKQFFKIYEKLIIFDIQKRRTIFCICLCPLYFNGLLSIFRRCVKESNSIDKDTVHVHII